MELIDCGSFFDRFEKKMFYVGFMRASETWFPLCLVSDPEKGGKLDTLFVSPYYGAMDDLLKAYASRISNVEQTVVQFLIREEIENIIERYALEKIALFFPEGSESGCGCGCGC